MSGPFGSSQWMYASGGFYNGVATQSLRSDQPSSSRLSQSMGTPTTRRKWTISFWLKRTKLALGVNATNSYNPLFASTNRLICRFDINDKIQLYDYDGNFDVNLVSTMQFRDTSAWYNIVIVTDIDAYGAGSENDRMKLYVNGVRQTWSGTNPASYDPRWNENTLTHYLIDDGQTTARFNGYVSDVTFLDGQAIGETDGYLNEFGELKNGIWIPKEYTGSYGNNGFRLEFKETGTGTASSSTIGADTSGNDNHFSSSGIVASDCDMPDSPENNFATFSSIDPSANSTLSQGNLQASGATSSTAVVHWQGDIVNGKYFVEFYISDVGSNWTYLGVASPTALYVYRSSDGNWYNNSSYVAYGSSYTTGDIIGLAVDVSNGTLEWFKNGVSQGSQTSLSLTDSYIYIAPTTSADTGTVIANFGQDSTFAGATTAGGNADANGIGDFKYSVPTGALALCTANLPEPTISPNAGDGKQADDYFNTALWNATGTQSVTGVGFQPDFLWLKVRSTSGSHHLMDVVRGAANFLQSDTTDAEANSPTFLTSFDSDGFSFGSNNWSDSRSMVGWNWKAGGTAVSNTDGSITSSVSANTDAGFSIVTYSGNGVSGATLGHGLSQAPNFAICKRRNSTANWRVGTDATGTLLDGYFNLTNSLAADSTTYQAFNSSTITLGNSADVNTTGGIGGSYVMYVFHNVEGYSKIGSYTGNSSTDGTFVYTGFRPAFVICKITSGANSWTIQDNARNINNPVSNYLLADDSGAEGTSGLNFDFVSNGFKLRTASGAVNASGATYIYMAFAETPTKYSLGR